MAEAVLQEVETYVSCRQNTVVKYIATRVIVDLCLEANQRTGPRVEMRWWEQEGLDLEGTRTVAHKAEQTESGEDTDGTDTATGNQLSEEDTVVNTNLGTKSNDPLAYDPVLEPHHPIMSKLGEHGDQEEKQREIYVDRTIFYYYMMTL